VDTTNYEQVPTTVNISWDGKYGANQDVPFEFTFFDENRELIKDLRYAYVILDEFDQEISRYDGDDLANPGIVSVEGIDIQKIYIPSEGQIRFDILVYGTGFDYDPKYAGIGSAIVEIGPGSSDPSSSVSPAVVEKTAIPDWIKNNAEWWAAGQIDDESFVQGIQYLIEKGIMKV
jgi:hypothetical protein